MTSTQRLTRAEARAAMTAAQGLTSRSDRSPESVAAEHGCLRTLGGVDAYLALHDRAPGLRRAVIDAAVAEHRLQVVPAMRGCIYLVPRDEVPWALRLADQMSRRRNEREQEKAGIAAGELETLGGTVVETLRRQGALSPSGLRSALPDGAVRSLGDAGKKLGLSSTLPPALRELELAGAIERALEGGRLDSERYVWRATEENPFAGVDGLDDPAAVHRHFAARFFAWAGLATVDAFGAWAGLGKRDSRAAVDGLGLVEVTVEDEGDYLATEAALAASGAGGGGGGGGTGLLPFIDNLVHLQNGPAVFVDPEHRDVPVPVWGRGQRTTLGDARHMSFRSLVADDRIAGFWEYDPDAAAVVAGCFAAPSPAARRALEERGAALARFLRDELGHGRSFSLDTDDHLRRRCGELRGLPVVWIAPAD